MSHQYTHSLHLKSHHFRTFAAHLAMVYITGHSPYCRSHLKKTPDYRHVADITGMPYLVAILKMQGIPVIPVAVGI